MKPFALTSPRSSGPSTLPDAASRPANEPKPIAEQPGAAAHAAAWERRQGVLSGDYRRHGSSLNVAFVSLCIYRFGRWGLALRNPIGRVLASRLFGLLNMLVANATKIWIPPQAAIGRDFHIIHTEGSLSIHPDAVIGDRVGVMHNVTIGTNMRPGAPVIGDDVFIGVNSTVLGAIRIGDRVRIAANTAVTTNIPADSIAVGSPAKIYPRLGAMK